MNELIAPILNALDNCFNQKSSFTEHDLITSLAEQDIEPFNKLNLKHNKDLFSAHFLTRHALYTLQNRYLKNQSYYLSISITKIERLTYCAGEQALQEEDQIKTYYLDFKHYLETDEDEINDLLTSFWEKYLASEHRVEAFEVLGLESDVSHATIKKRYRELAQKHHPDKGGDPEYFQSITEAKQTLDKLFS